MTGNPTILPEIRRAKEIWKAIEEKCNVRIIDGDEAGEEQNSEKDPRDNQDRDNVGEERNSEKGLEDDQDRDKSDEELDTEDRSCER